MAKKPQTAEPRPQTESRQPDTESEQPKRKVRKRVFVRATQTGYYNHARRRPGDVFELVEREIGVIDPKTGRPVMEKREGKREPKMRISPIEEQFSENWMEYVDDPGARETHPTGAQDAINRQNNELMLENAKRKSSQYPD